MRAGICVIAAAVAMLFGASAKAQTFPDLPGMGAVAKTTHSNAPSATRSVSAPSTSSASKPATPVSTSAVKPAAKGPDVSSILNMPGSRSLPVISDLRTASHTPMAHADLLFVLAGIGTATALGMLWAVRRRYDRT